MTTHSYIAMDAEKLRGMCKLALETLDIRRRADVVENIERHRKRESQQGWLGRTFWPKPAMTYAQAEAELRNITYINAATYEKWNALEPTSYEQEYNTVKKLLALAEHGNPVYVTGEELSVVTSFL